MDKDAINAASDDVLKEFGLCAKGDIIALRAFCFSESKVGETDKVEELKAAIRNNERITKKRGKQRTIQLGWMHYDKKTKTYKAVRAKTGGGCRSLKVDESSSKKELLEMAKDIFCDKKTCFGPVSTLTFDIGSFSTKPVEDDFILSTYIEKHHLQKVRLYLLTRLKSFYDMEFSDSGDDFTDDLPIWNNLSTPKLSTFNSPNVSSEDSQINWLALTSKDNSCDSLIGTSLERKELSAEIDHAYMESLNADRKKN